MFMQVNALESVVCERATILYRPQWVKYIHLIMQTKANNTDYFVV